MEPVRQHLSAAHSPTRQSRWQNIAFSARARIAKAGGAASAELGQDSMADAEKQDKPADNAAAPSRFEDVLLPEAVPSTGHGVVEPTAGITAGQTPAAAQEHVHRLAA